MNTKNFIRKISIIFSIVFFLLINFKLSAQNDSIKDDLSKYFDDGGLSDGKNVVKIAATSLINGDLSFLYERVLNKSVGIELGIGLLLPYYIGEIGIVGIEVTNPKFGYSLWFHPKYYLNRQATKSYYVGTQYTRRNYFQTNYSIILTDIVLDAGGAMIIGNRITLESFFGMGIHFNHNIKNDKILKIGLSYQLGIKIGYII